MPPHKSQRKEQEIRTKYKTVTSHGYEISTQKYRKLTENII